MNVPIVTRYAAAAALALQLGCSACGGSGQSLTQAAPTPTDEAAAPVTIKLTLGGQEKSVALSTLPRQDYKGTSVVTLGAVWGSGALGDRASLDFDFEGDDGFRPSTKDRCKTPVHGAELDKGYLVPETRTIVWDDALGKPGCYAVRFVAKILATKASKDAGAD
jgi:hypothetical protein